jgi:exodeoxyribonuclease III
MRIISWNTNGLRATVKQGFFHPLFKSFSPDIVCLQETKSEPEQLPLDIKDFPKYNSYFAYSKIKKGYSGVAIYSKIKPDKVTGLGIKKFDDEGRTLVLYFDSAPVPFVLINCYFPNGGGGPERLEYKMEFYDAFLEFIDDLKKKKKKIIFCGDINTAHEEIDLARPKENEKNTGFLPQERAWLDEVVLHGYTDVFRYLHPNKRASYTYWDQKTRARDRNVGWRIDYFFVIPALLKNIKRIEHITDYYGSDHCPVLLDIDLK